MSKLHREAHGAVFAARPVLGDSSELAARVHAQAQEISQLQATVEALSELLVDSGLVHRDALEVRVAAAVAGRQSTVTPAYRPTARRACCTGCGRTVSAARIFFTDRGQRCASCCDRMD